MKKIKILIGLSFMLATSFGKVLHVPSEYGKIQTAMDAALYGDTVLVAPGIYFENLMFRDKNITLASNYIFSKDKNDILTTIIDGSKPTYADSASCVMFYSKNDTLAVLEGFTLTHGSGAKTIFPPSTVVIEGGGILMVHSRATVRNNLIKENTVNYWGGGGIATFLGNPKILNNVIFNNSAGYAGGIVLNVSDGIIKNNIIYHNIQTEKQWLTGGIMVWDSPGVPVIENNTIVGNIACTRFGGISITSKSKPVVTNNIVWANRQASGTQFEAPASAKISYCNTEDTIAGEGMIYSDPLFENGSFTLSSESPCIDAGKADNLYNDKTDNSNPNKALFPSLGTTRNDMGAYGGWGAEYMLQLEIEDMHIAPVIDFGKVLVNTSKNKQLEIINLGTVGVSIDSIRQTKPEFIRCFDEYNEFDLFHKAQISFDFIPFKEGIYSDTVKIYHSGKTIPNPIKLVLKGVGNLPSEIKEKTKNQDLSISPNPVKNYCTIHYSLKEASPVKLILSDINGKQLKLIVDELKNTGDFQYQLNCSSFKKGTYFLQFIHQNGESSCKFILK